MNTMLPPVTSSLRTPLVLSLLLPLLIIVRVVLAVRGRQAEVFARGDVTDGDECHFTCVEFHEANDAPMESREQPLSKGTRGVP